MVFTSALTAQPQACMPQAYSRCLINPGKMTMHQSGNVNCHCQSEAERRGSRRWVRGAREGEVGARGRVPVGEGGLGSAAQGGRWFPDTEAAPGQRLSAALSRGRRVPAPRRERFRRTGDKSNNSTCARTAARATSPGSRFIPFFYINGHSSQTHTYDYLPPFLSSRTALGSLVLLSLGRSSHQTGSSGDAGAKLKSSP